MVSRGACSGKRMRLTRDQARDSAGFTIVRSRRAFVITDTDDRLIASAAIIGERSKPIAGYKTPAAIGTHSAL